MLLSKTNPSTYPLDHILSTVLNILSLLDHYQVSISTCCKKPSFDPVTIPLTTTLYVLSTQQNYSYESFMHAITNSSTYLNLLDLFGFYYLPSKCSESPSVKVTSDFQIAKIYGSVLSHQLDLSFFLTNKVIKRIK